MTTLDPSRLLGSVKDRFHRVLCSACESHPRWAFAALAFAVPLRAINVDVFPTNVDGAKKIKADFDAVRRFVPHCL